MAENASTEPSWDTVLAAAFRLCESHPQSLLDITTLSEASCYPSLVMNDASKVLDSESTSGYSKIQLTGSRPEPGQRDLKLRQCITRTYLAYHTVNIPYLQDVYEYCDKGGSRWTSAITMCVLVLQYQRFEPPAVSDLGDLVPLMNELCELRLGLSTPKAWQQDADGNLVRPTE